MSATVLVQLCEDCILADSGYDTHPEYDATPMSKLPDTLISPVYTDDTESEVEQHFSWDECDGCDTKFGGTRYAYHAVSR